MRFMIETLGCKVNQYESQALEALLRERGHSPWSDPAGCTARIINTCAVTAESGRKSRQAVRRARKESPDAVIAVCGCYSQISPEEAEAIGADLVSGSGDRRGFVEELERVCADRVARKNIDAPLKRRMFELLPAGSVPGHTRAMLKIQDGCSNFCTYCIIPYARGPVRSMPLSAVGEAAADLRGRGFLEIVVTGIEISSYGADFKDGTSLIDAVRAISQNAPGVRIHLGSLEPRTADEAFAAGLAEVPDVCPHFHLSLQSGCDATLRRMNRKYDTARFYEGVALLRKHFPGCGITTDLITGFPGETESEFSETLVFIEKCAFSAMHIFPYSARPGTPAAGMPDQIPRETKRERARAAAEVAARMSADFAASKVGEVKDVLFETEANGMWTGHTGDYLEVTAPGTGLKNRILPVRIERAEGASLFGHISHGSSEI